MISVIIPTYNRKKLLCRAIDSVFHQTVSDFEIIVVDDGSTDNTSSLLEQSYQDRRLRYDRLEHNKGVHCARNRGLDLAQGEFVVFLDSDDELLPTALEKSRSVFGMDSKIGMVSAPYRLPSGELTGFNRTQAGYVDFVDSLCERNLRREKGGFVMIKRSVIGDIRWPTKYVQFVFFRLVARKTSVFFIPEPLGLYHINSDNLSVTKIRHRVNIKVSIERSRALADFLEKFGAELLSSCPENYGHFAYGAAIGLLLDGKKKEAVKLAEMAVKYRSYKLNYRCFALFARLPFSSIILRVLFNIRRFLEN